MIHCKHYDCDCYAPFCSADNGNGSKQKCIYMTGDEEEINNFLIELELDYTKPLSDWYKISFEEAEKMVLQQTEEKAKQQKEYMSKEKMDD